VAGDVGVLFEAAGAVGEPLAAEGHVDPKRVAGVANRFAQGRGDAVEHLELVAVFRDLVFFLPFQDLSYTGRDGNSKREGPDM